MKFAGWGGVLMNGGVLTRIYGVVTIPPTEAARALMVLCIAWALEMCDFGV